MPVLNAILPSNQIHIERVVERVLAEKRREIGMLGLSFKAGTDDLRESPLVTSRSGYSARGCGYPSTTPKSACRD